jgi:ribosomal protein S17E
MNSREIVEKLLDRLERDLEQNYDIVTFAEIQTYATLLLARRTVT